MDKPLTPETQSQIRALCESIAQRDQLGEDVQEELRGHIEDKIIGYLDGHEAVTEQDAVILAREHFGDAFAVKTLLQTAHPMRTTISLGRRIAVVLLLTLLVQVLMRMVCDPLSNLLVQHLSTGIRYVLWFAFEGAPYVLGVPLITFLVLKRARNRIAPGTANWLSNAPRSSFRLATIVILALWLIRPDVLGPLIEVIKTGPVSTGPVSQSAPQMSQTTLSAILQMMVPLKLALQIVGTTALCLVWIWWCDQTPRTLFNIRAAASAWLSFEILTLMFGWIAQFGGDVSSKILFDWFLNNSFTYITFFALSLIAAISGFTYAKLNPAREEAAYGE